MDRPTRRQAQGTMEWIQETGPPELGIAQDRLSPNNPQAIVLQAPRA